MQILRPQKLWEWGPAICALMSSSCWDSDVCWSLRITGLELRMCFCREKLHLYQNPLEWGLLQILDPTSGLQELNLWNLDVCKPGRRFWQSRSITDLVEMRLKENFPIFYRILDFGRRDFERRHIDLHFTQFPLQVTIYLHSQVTSEAWILCLPFFSEACLYINNLYSLWCGVGG